MIEPINYGLALRRGWRLLLALAVIFGIVAVLLPVSAKAKPTGIKGFKWQAVAIVGAPPTAGLGDSGASVADIVYWSNDFYTKANAVAAVGLSKSVVQVVGAMSGAPSTEGPPAKTSVSTKATKGVKATVVLLTAPGKTPNAAAKLANEYAYQTGLAVNKSYEAHAQQFVPKGTQSTSASIPPSGYNPIVPAYSGAATKLGGKKASLGSSHKVRLIAGVLIGLVVGAAILLIRELLDKTIRTAGRAESTFRYPVIAVIPKDSVANRAATSGSVVPVVNQPGSPTAEAYRMLRMSVLFEALAPTPSAPDAFSAEGLTGWQVAQVKPYEAPASGTRQVLLVVSAANEVSRPMAAANLGATYAEAGQRVIVISTDDIPSGFVPETGLDQVPSFGPADLAVQLQASSLPNVSRLSLRPFVSGSGQLVNRAPALFAAARELADVVIVETPGVLAVHHAEALVHAVDVVLVVGECATTTMDEARRTSEVLRRLGAPVLGVVLTNATGPQDARKPDDAPTGPVAEPAPAGAAQPVPEATQA
jgi:Mrp family chromosome partitioning ATPase/capsular polysaccharide biosynthesis protein